MTMRIDVLFQGFPGISDRGFLGWSSCVLIRLNGKAPILFDTAGFNERRMLLDRLNRLGVNKEDIGTVFLSHFHFDHAVNYPLFQNAVFYLHEDEAKYVDTVGDKDLAVPAEMFPSLRDSGRLSILKGKSGVVEGFDWMHTPGHTPGLCSLFLNHEGKRWALASDAVKNISELITGEVAAAWCDNKSRESINAIKDWADIIVPGHDRMLQIQRNPVSIQVKPISNNDVEIKIPWLETPYRIKV